MGPEGMPEPQPSPESGQSMVYITLSMVALLAFLALVLDGGFSYVQRRRMQNAADAGALAGAWEIAFDGSPPKTPEERAWEYAERNGADSAQVTVDGNTATVTATVTSPTFFASVIGMDSITVSASAAAQIRFGCGGCAIWASEKVDIKGKEKEDKHTVVGNVHSNDDVKCSGGHTIRDPGTVSCGDQCNPFSCSAGQVLPGVPQQPWPVSYDLAEYEDMAKEAGRYFTSNLTFSGEEDDCDLVDGLYYTTGNVTINCKETTRYVTIVAEGMITLNEAMNLFSYSDGLLLFSDKDGEAIKLKEGATLRGIVYAPNGHIKIEATYLTLYGSMIGEEVLFTGGSSGAYIEFTEEYCPPGNPYISQ